MRRRLEQLADLLLALTVLSWAVLPHLTQPTAETVTPVRLTISAMHLAVAVLLLRRAPEQQAGSPWQVAQAIPGLLVAGLALQAAPPLPVWPALAEGVFVLGGVWAVVSLGWLGQSFAILPARRAVRSSGPYRLVRHPAYAGELVMIIACALAASPERVGWAWAVVVAAVVAVAVRIRAEERLLMTDADYSRYAVCVRWRLVPGVW